MVPITFSNIKIVVAVSVYFVVITLVIVAEKDLMMVMIVLMGIRWTITAANIVSVHHNASRRTR